MAVKARSPSREQVQYRYISEMRSLWQGATQPEDYMRIEECEVSEYQYNNIRLVQTSTMRQGVSFLRPTLFQESFQNSFPIFFGILRQIPVRQTITGIQYSIT